MVERVQIHIGEELGRLIAERQAAAAVVGGEKGVAGKVANDFVLRIRCGDDLFGERERGFTFQDAAELGGENIVVNGREVFADVALEGVRVTAAGVLGQGDGLEIGRAHV